MTSDAGERPTADVRVLAESELAAVEQQIDFDWGNPGKHRDRLREQQAGEAAYLVAWYGKQPIGHALVKWNGPTHRAIAATLGRCAEIEDLFVHPSYRSTGVGSKLLEYATKLAKQQGAPYRWPRRRHRQPEGTEALRADRLQRHGFRRVHDPLAMAWPRWPRAVGSRNLQLSSKTPVAGDGYKVGSDGRQAAEKFLPMREGRPHTC